MLLRPPDAITHGPVLGDETDRAQLAGEVHLDGGGIERSVDLLLEHTPEQPDDFRRGGAARIFGPRDHGFDVRVDVELREPLRLPVDLAVTQQAWQRVVGDAGREEREILGEIFGYEKEAIALDELFFHGQEDSE
jgi:hypothetical protein